MLFARTTQAHQLVLTTSYPSESGILRTSVSKCNEKRVVRFLPSFPEDLRVSLPLRFLFPFSLGRLSTAILTQLCGSGSTESIFFSYPKRLWTNPPTPALSQPFGHGGPSCHTKFTEGGEDSNTNLIFIQTLVLHELSDRLFLMAVLCIVTLPLGLDN